MRYDHYKSQWFLFKIYFFAILWETWSWRALNFGEFARLRVNSGAGICWSQGCWNCDLSAQQLNPAFCHGSKNCTCLPLNSILFNHCICTWSTWSTSIDKFIQKDIAFRQGLPFLTIIESAISQHDFFLGIMAGQKPSLLHQVAHLLHLFWVDGSLLTLPGPLMVFYGDEKRNDDTPQCQSPRIVTIQFNLNPLFLQTNTNKYRALYTKRAYWRILCI
jgi:hypothetical protein